MWVDPFQSIEHLNRTKTRSQWTPLYCLLLRHWSYLVFWYGLKHQPLLFPDAVTFGLELTTTAFTGSQAFGLRLDYILTPWVFTSPTAVLGVLSLQNYVNQFFIINLVCVCVCVCVCSSDYLCLYI
jgi:hypothetical protein